MKNVTTGTLVLVIVGLSIALIISELKRSQTKKELLLNKALIVLYQDILEVDKRDREATQYLLDETVEASKDATIEELKETLELE